LFSPVFIRVYTCPSVVLISFAADPLRGAFVVRLRFFNVEGK